MSVAVLEHHRCGNHWFRALLGENFLYGYTADIQPNTPFEIHALYPSLFLNMKYFYLVRKPEDALRSVFDARDMYGLKVATFEEFKSRKYTEMFSPKEAIYRRHVVEIKEGGEYPTRYFKVRPMTDFQFIDMRPGEYIQMHVDHYQKLKLQYPDNLHIVSYDSLKANFKATMDDVAVFLGVRPKGTYANVNVEVGVAPVPLDNIPKGQRGNIIERVRRLPVKMRMPVKLQRP